MSHSASLITALQRTKFIMYTQGVTEMTRDFSVTAPSVWNALPQHMTLTFMTAAAFRK